MATHCSILASEIPQRSLMGYNAGGRKESVTKQERQVFIASKGGGSLGSTPTWCLLGWVFLAFNCSTMLC